MLQIHLLGSFRLTHDGRALAFRAPPRTLPLLAALALSGDAPVSREALAVTLWPDATTSEGRANLRRHLHYLRGALPPGEWFSADPTFVRWHAGESWLDVHAFEALSRDPNRLEEAAALYRGDLLEGLDEEWVFYERERLRAGHLVNLSALVTRYRAALDYPRAIFYAERLLAADPLREDMVRQLATLHAGRGNRAVALSVLEQFRAVLNAELGIPPMPETAALHDRLRRGELLDLFVPSTPPERGDPWQLPLVGREAELGALKDAWRRVRSGPGQTLLLGGEAGVGKTRLARELALQAEAEGTLVLVGRTTSPETRPHQALADALGTAAPLLLDLPGAEDWLPALATLIPAIRVRHPGLPELPTLPPERERERLAAAVAGALAALGQARPVLLVLEDLHWASEASLGLVEFLARAAPARTLLLATHRDDLAPGHPLRALRQRLREEQAAQSLALARLNPESALAAVGRDLPRDLARLVAARSEGLPLYLTELTFEARRGGEVGLPRGLGETVRARLERLGPVPRALVDVAAVLGPTFVVDVLGDVSGWPEGELYAAVDDLLSARFLREAFGGHLAFVHGLVQESVYAGIDANVRRRLHRRAGLTLEERLPAGSAAAVARHLDLGGEGERAAGHYLAAAREAVAVGAPDEALHFLDRALTFTHDVPGRFELLALREEVTRRSGELREWEADLAALAQCAQEWGSLEARREALFRRIPYHRRVGEPGRAAELIRELQELAQGAPLWAARAALLKGRWHYVRGEQHAAMQALRAARPSFEALGRRNDALSCLQLEALVEIKRGHLDAAQARLDSALELAEASRNPQELATAYDIALMLAEAREDDEAQYEYARRHREVALALFDRNIEATAETHLGSSSILLLRYAEGQAHYVRAGELYRQIGRKQGETAVLFNLGCLDLFLGDYRAGLEKLARANALAQETGDHTYRTVYLVTAAQAHCALGEYSLACTLAEQGLALTEQESDARARPWALAWRGVAEHGLGKYEAAERTLQEAAALFRADRLLSGLTLALCHLASVLLSSGDLPAATEVAGELGTLDPARMRPEDHDRYFLTLARVALAHGHADEAAQYAGQARAALRRKVEAIPDEGLRAAYLDLPFSREVLGSVSSDVLSSS
ncbi:ATP-binding protein [Deinococcus apachensis]|uniref:ATP-binding protein n=1 Tax=Deinococcus apachensis TaxID=309886 RepID=UPI000367DF69|nr:AAA family ATPase [Deinococcus apachensis]